MHVGVCMRIEADNRQEAEDITQDLLSKYSQNEMEYEFDVTVKLEELYEYITGIKEENFDTIRLFFEVGGFDKISDILFENVVGGTYEDLVGFGDDYDKDNPVLMEVVKVINEEIEEDELYSLYLHDEFYPETIHPNYDEKTVSFTISGISNTGVWDYDYGISEDFGLSETADPKGCYRVYTSYGKSEIEKKNKKFLEKLYNGTEKEFSTLSETVDYWLNDNEEFGGDEDFLREMFSNLTEKTFIVVASVHV